MKHEFVPFGFFVEENETGFALPQTPSQFEMATLARGHVKNNRIGLLEMMLVKFKYMTGRVTLQSLFVRPSPSPCIISEPVICVGAGREPIRKHFVSFGS